MRKEMTRMSDRIKRKLTSRKLWVAVAGFVALIIVAAGGTEGEAAESTAIIMAGAAVIAYIVGEGLVDASNKGASDSDSTELGDGGESNE
jgi:hypothetical protein